MIRFRRAVREICEENLSILNDSHNWELSLNEGLNGLVTHLRRNKAIVRCRRATTLNVTKNHHVGVHVESFLQDLLNLIASTSHRTFGHDDDRRFFSTSDTTLNIVNE